MPGLSFPPPAALAPPQLQQDKDMAYWNVSLEEITRATRTFGIELLRTPVSAGREPPHLLAACGGSTGCGSSRRESSGLAGVWLWAWAGQSWRADKNR